VWTTWLRAAVSWAVRRHATKRVADGPILMTKSKLRFMRSPVGSYEGGKVMREVDTVAHKFLLMKGSLCGACHRPRHDRGPALVHRQIHRPAPPCVRDCSWMLSWEHGHGFSSFTTKQTHYLSVCKIVGLCHVSFWNVERYTVSAVSSHCDSKIDGLIVHVPRTPPGPPRQNGRALFDSDIHCPA